MTWSRNIMIKHIKEHLHKFLETKLKSVYINSTKERTRFLDEINYNDIIISLKKELDPFTTTNINLRSGFKLQKLCCICGTANIRSTSVQAHNIKYIRKGKVEGIAQILR